jgi:hypothetical protein
MNRTFAEFSTLVSPELADLDLKAKDERQILKHLYELSMEAVKTDQLRIQFLEEVKKVGPRLKKYYWLAAAMKNAQKFIAKAQVLCKNLGRPAPSSDFSVLLQESMESVKEALRILDASRRYILGFEVPDYLRKKVADKTSEERHRLAMEFLEDWENNGPPFYMEGISFEEWLELVSGTVSSTRLEALGADYSLRHFGTYGAIHRLIRQAESFLCKKTSAGPTLRQKIIKKTIVTAFPKETWELPRIDGVIGKAYKKSGTPRSKRPRLKKNHA